MKRALLFLFLAGVFSVGQAVADEDTAQAVNGVVLLRDQINDPGSVLLSRVLVAKKIVCIEYQRRNKLRTGFAVYKTDQDVVWIDNSWVWQRTCGTGKYGRLRDGKDVTEAVSAALKAQSAASHPPAPTARVANPLPSLSFIPAVSVAAPMPGPQAPPPAELVPSRPQPIPATRPAALVTPIASTAVPQPKATAPVRDPAPVQEPVPAVARPPLTPQPVTVAPATVSVVVAPTAQHSTAARMALQPAPVAAPNTVTQVLVPRGELGTIRGVTIVDNRGALASTDAAPVVSESLGDAARRLRKAKQQQAARP